MIMSSGGRDVVLAMDFHFGLCALIMFYGPQF